MIERERQKLLKWLTPYIVRLIDSKLGSVFSRHSEAISSLGDYLKRDGSVTLVGNLSVVDGKTIDGIDVSELGISYSLHLATDGHPRYAEAAGYTNRPAAVATTLTRSVTANAPITGGGTLTGDIALGLSLGTGLETSSGNLRLNPNVAGDGLSHSSGVLSVNTSGGLTVDGDSVKIASSAAGSGLSIAGGILSLNLGQGLELWGDDAILAASVAGNGLDYTAGVLSVGLSDGLEFDGDSIAHAETYQHYHPIYPRTAENETVAGQWDFDEYVGLNNGAVTDNDLVPLQSHSHSVGSAIKPFNSIHAAELHVGNIVAQDTIATIGGSILVTPSTHLSVDLTDVVTTITVDHNIFEAGDTAILKDGGFFEVLKVTSAVAYNSDGTFSYNVDRNQDGSGANNWVAGTAVASLGGIHDGWIDIFSTTPATGSGHGPTIAFYHREGTTWNDYVEHTVLGSLHGFYDYDSHIHGFAAGDPDDVWVAVDDTNGFRIMNGADQKAKWGTDGVIYLGSDDTGEPNIVLGATSMKLRQGTTDKIVLNSDGSITIADENSSVSVKDTGVIIEGEAGLSVGVSIGDSDDPGFSVVQNQGVGIYHNDGYFDNDPSKIELLDWNSGVPISRLKIELGGYSASPQLSMDISAPHFPIENSGGSLVLSSAGTMNVNGSTATLQANSGLGKVQGSTASLIATGGDANVTASAGVNITPSSGNSTIHKPIFTGRVPYGARVHSTVTQNISSGSLVAVNWATAISNPYSIWSAGAPSRFTVTKAGYYSIGGGIRFANMGAINVTVEVLLRVNGSTYIAQNRQFVNNIEARVPVVAGYVYLNVNDYVELVASQNSGSSRNIEGNLGSNYHDRYFWISEY